MNGHSFTTVDVIQIIYLLRSGDTFYSLYFLNSKRELCMYSCNIYLTTMFDRIDENGCEITLVATVLYEKLSQYIVCLINK